tara:strand:+ start:149 stop:775 length:627 start_codon:yes stop_codon:yes gene_type:complete
MPVATTCFLTAPDARFRDSFLEGATEFATENRLDSTYAPYLGFDLHTLKRRFESFVSSLAALADAGRSPHRYVDRVLWLIDDGDYVGQASIRPELCTNYLITYGGHIGYSIRPSRRQQGFGRQILALSLAAAKKMSLSKVLVTCNSDNPASKRIIEANGGQFEKSLKMDSIACRAEGSPQDDQVLKLRYWIDLHPPPETAAKWTDHIS